LHRGCQYLCRSLRQWLYSQILHQWIIEPFEEEYLKPQGIDTILFCLGNGIRGLPLAALSDGEQFLIENNLDFTIEKSPLFGKSRTEEWKKKFSVNRPKPMLGKKHSEETKLIIAKNHKGKPGPNKGKFKELNPNWKGGNSFNPDFGVEWTSSLKDWIKQRDNYTCMNPGCLHKSQRLSVHHINYNKKDCSENNLITLCKKCHDEVHALDKHKFGDTNGNNKN
jgi:hypothetical protein